MSPVPVAVVGASGFLGAEVVRLLATHPEVELAVLAAGSSAGKPVGAVRPSLAGLGDRTFEPVDAENIAERCELCFVALPHGQSAALAARLAGRVRVIDLGSDFRLRAAADYPRYYGREHPCPELLPRARYALPELTGGVGPDDDVDIIANPGCFATALALGIAPLAPALTAGARVVACGVTGSSGSGISPTARVHHSLRCSTLGAYKPLTHQHLGELRQLLADGADDGRAVPPIDFVPHSGPLTRGIHLTLTLRADELDGDAHALLAERYADAALVRVLREPAQLGAVVGSCRADIGVIAGDGAVVVTVVIDNLLKGGSGQAVQNMNLWLGLPELTAVPTLGVWP